MNNLFKAGASCAAAGFISNGCSADLREGASGFVLNPFVTGRGAGGVHYTAASRLASLATHTLQSGCEQQH